MMSSKWFLKKKPFSLKPIVSPRKGWDQEFSKMHSDHADDLLVDDVFQDETFEEWK